MKPQLFLIKNKVSFEIYLTRMKTKVIHHLWSIVEIKKFNSNMNIIQIINIASLNFWLSLLFGSHHFNINFSLINKQL